MSARDQRHPLRTAILRAEDDPLLADGEADETAVHTREVDAVEPLSDPRDLCGQGLVAAGPARQNVPRAAQSVGQATPTNPPEPAFPGVPFLTRQVAPPFRVLAIQPPFPPAAAAALPRTRLAQATLALAKLAAEK